jgi:glucose-6-phosphate 1-epimerase
VTPPEPSPVVVLRSADGAMARVHADGAHVTSWRPAPDGGERLFLSGRTELREGVAIRGGIPLIFPQFAAEGPLPRHGFARTMRWSVERESDAEVAFRLSDTPATRAVWPAAFEATLRAAIGGRTLSVTLGVVNSGDAPMSFTAALHTYLRVRDIGETWLEGLRGVRYRESSAPGVLTLDEGDRLRSTGEVDRVYVDVPGPVVLRDGIRTLEIVADGFPDVVVWNPGAEKAATLADMEPGGERRMLCVEAAAVQRPVTLAPGESWRGAQALWALAG